jgi:uncharacterized protein (TIGR02118 family)
MFKRMSILLRLPGDDRSTFARKWENHGLLVKQLPYIRGYMQNHVLEEFAREQPIEADGIVELLFDRPEDMTSAFSSPEAAPVKADEPGFLGHGTGYALSKASRLVPAKEGNKLFVITSTPHASLLERILDLADKEFGVTNAFRDDVVSVISRPEMARGPQCVASFLHIYFRNASTATAAGAAISSVLRGEASAEKGGSVFRVRTHTVVF